MSRFDELDHKIGRHEGKPHPDCSVCHPGTATSGFTAAASPWDYVGPGAPAFPDWGTVWNHRGEMVTFVNPTHGVLQPKETDARDMGGFWTPIHNVGTLNTKDSTPVSEMWSHEPKQVEFGSGKWSPRVKTLALSNTIPDEAGLSSPMGVNLLKWAKDQNHAKIVVEMGRNNLFPISEIQHEETTIMITRATKITSTVMTIPMEPLEGLLST